MAGKTQYGPNDWRMPDILNNRQKEMTVLPSQPQKLEDIPVAPPTDFQNESPVVWAENTIRNISKQLNPKYGSREAQVYNFSKDQYKKYIDEPYGFIPGGVDNDDFYSDQEGFWGYTGKFVPRLALRVGAKLGQTLGFIWGVGSETVKYTGDVLGLNNYEGSVIGNAADNAVSKYFREGEDYLKNESWFKTFNSLEDRDKGFWGRFFTDKEMWSEDIIDGAAFMGAAWIPGMTLSKIGFGKMVTKGMYKIGGKPIANPSVLGSVEEVAAGTNYFTNAQKIANNIDKYSAWGIATMSESLFEAKEMKDRIYESLAFDEFGLPRINPNTGRPYTEQEKKDIATGGARNGFLMNAILLSFTNLAELPYASKLFGIGKKVGVSAGVGAGLTGGTTLADQVAAKVPKKGWQSFLDGNYGTFAKGATSGIIREGFVEENAQLAIQRLNEFYGANGRIVDMLDFSTLTGLTSDTFNQAYKAVKGDDPEAAMNIGLGGFLGGLMTGAQTRSQAKRDKIDRAMAIERYNEAQESWYKFGNIYQTETVTKTDENGNQVTEERIVFDSQGQPVEDQNKIAAVLSGAKGYTDQLKDSEALAEVNPFLRNMLRDKAFAELVRAHIGLGIEDTLVKKLDGLQTADPVDLAKLGFAKDPGSEATINRYKQLANLILNQNKALNADIIFGKSQEEEMRRNKLAEYSTEQAIMKNLLSEEITAYENKKTELLNTENTSLSDGLVDQLNSLNFRIAAQEQVIASLEEGGERAALQKLNKEYLQELQKKKDDLIKNNEESVSQLKQKDGMYLYEKEARNEPAMFNSLNKNLALKGSLENVVGMLGKKWGFLADFKNGKQNALKLFDDEVVTPINQEIEKEQQDDNDESFDDIINLEEEGLDQDTQDIELGTPSLETYLRERYDDLVTKPEGRDLGSFEEFKSSVRANPYITFYNNHTGKNEPLNKGLEVSNEDTEDVDNELLNDVNQSEDENVPTNELGTKALSTLKLGPYTINLGDRINDEEITAITDEVVQVGDNLLSHTEVRKLIDAFKGRNITRKGQKTADTSIENGEIPDVQDTSIDTQKQTHVNKNGEKIEYVYGGSDKVVRAGSKVNSTSELYIRDVVSPGRIDRRRIGANPNYPMVLGTPDINIGTKLKLVADTQINNFNEYNSVNPAEKVARTAADFFDGKSIKKNQVDSFPVKITAEVNGKEIFIGYLPTVKWVETRWDNGVTANVVETLPDGTDNMTKQIEDLRKLRQLIFKQHNANPNFEVTAVVDEKSEGKLRLDMDKSLHKLSEIVHPDTKLGIIRNGMVHVGVDEIVDPKEVIGIKDPKEGRPVMIVNTPKGNQMLSYVAVPKLSVQHQQFIVSAWSAFHRVMNSKDLSKIPDQVAIVKAVYEAYDAPFEEGVKPDFNVLRNYVNDYITYTSSKKQYNPLLKVGTSQLNITEDGQLIVYVVKDKKKESDLAIAKNPSEFQSKQDSFQEKLSELYYNVKTSTEFSNGVNSTAKMKYLSVIGNKLKQSEPLTYNEYMMNILETALEKGRPVDPKDPNSPFVHFANPVVTFNVVGDNSASLVASVSDVITDDVYNNFVDKNVVSDNVLNSIADKVIARTPLSQRETAIFSGKTSEINEIIRKKAPTTAPASITELAKQATPEDIGNLLDLDIDFGDTAEDIGNVEVDPSDLKSIRTSLKELKKSCD